MWHAGKKLSHNERVDLQEPIRFPFFDLHDFLTDVLVCRASRHVLIIGPATSSFHLSALSNFSGGRRTGSSVSQCGSIC